MEDEEKDNIKGGRWEKTTEEDKKMIKVGEM